MGRSIVTVSVLFALLAFAGAVWISPAGASRLPSSGGLGTMVKSLNAVFGFFQSSTAEVEPNETFEQANPISIPGQKTGQVRYGDAAVYEFKYNNGARDKIEDFFKFLIPTGTTRRLDIVLTFSNPAVDVDLLLFRVEDDGTLTPLAVSNGSTTTERITPIQTFGGGTYMIGVSAFDDPSNTGTTSYTLSVTPDTAPPPPVISTIIPAATVAGGGPFSLTVNGSYFISGQSVVRWNGSPRTTTYINDTQLVAFISAADIAQAGVVTVTVFNPPSLGGSSNPATFTILPQGTPEPEVEPNETSQQANLLLLPGKRSGNVGVGDAAQLTIQLNNGLSDPVEDLFAVNLAQSSRLDLKLNGANQNSNLALYLLREGPEPGQITPLGNSRLSGPVQRITTPAALAAGRYLVGVSAVTGSSSYVVEAAVPGKRLLQVIGSSAAPNSTVTVPVVFDSEGDENTVNFSLSFNTAVLSNPQVSAGKDAGAGTLSVNSSQTALGRIGIRYSLPQGQKLSAGPRELVTVRFGIITAASSNSTTIDFGDDPVVREIVDYQGNFLIGSYSSGGVVIVPGFEADVSPRPNGSGDGNVTIADWAQIGRFISGIDSPVDGGEFQRADCAPKATLGDGRLTVSDWVQAGRYAAGIEPPPAAGGPSAPVASSQAYFEKVFESNDPRLEQQQARTIKIRDAVLQRGADNVLRLELAAQGNENGVGFSLNFDVSQLVFVSATAGADAAGAVLIVNNQRLSEGRLGVGLALPGGQTFPAGVRELVKLTFNVLPTSSVNATTISFGDIPIKREVADAGAAVIDATFAPTIFQIQPEVNLIPSLSSLSPSTAFAGGQAFALTINGANFIQGAVALVNGSDRPTQFVSATELRATVLADDLIETGSLSITVRNPVAGTAVSNALPLAVVNPAPTLASISPSSAAIGARGFTLAVTGTGFVPGAVVQFGGKNRTTIFVNSTQLNAAILDSDLTDAGTYKVRAVNPQPGGGASNELDFRVAPISPVPRIQGLNPESVLVGSAAFTLTVNGQGYVNGSVVRFNGNDLPTTFVSANQLTARVAAELVTTAGTAAITVRNQAPGGGDSNAFQFGISVPPNPVPSITTISPTVVTSGGPQFTLIVNGTNFVKDSVVRFNDASRPTTFITTTQLSAQIFASDIANGGTASVRVFNPAPGGGASNEATMTINFAAPTIVQISPNSAVAGGPAFTLSVFGTNFVQGSIVRWNGENRQTVYSSVTELSAQITAADIAGTGTASVTVFSPEPGGGVSNAVTFTINQAARPLPRITSISPDNIGAGSGEFTITVNGTNFVSDSAVKWNNVPKPTTFVSSTQLTARIPAADIATPGTARVAVFTPAPGGGDSNGLSFTINQPPNPVPAITAIDPATVIAGAADFMLTVSGSGFVSGSTVQFEGENLPTTFVNAGQLKALVASALIAASGSARIKVVSPAPGGGPSNEVILQIANPVPVITGLDPAVAVEGGTDFILRVNGTGFAPGAEVRVNGVARQTLRPSATQLTVTITAPEIAAAGTLNIQVFNQAPGGGLSNAVKLDIRKRNPLPRLTAIVPETAPAGGSGFTLVLTGSNFVEGSIVRVNGQDRKADFVSDTTLAVQITADDIASPGTIAISVFNPEPGGGRSSILTLAVNNPTPRLTSISPTSVVAGSQAFDLIVNGEGFVQNSTVRLNGAALQTSFISRTQLSALVPSASIASPGALPVAVSNPLPGGGTSNAINLTVANPQPSIASISPAQVTAGSLSFTLTVNGSGFVAGSTVTLNAQPIDTAPAGAGVLTATVPASAVAAAGSAEIRVLNPEPGGGASNAVQLSIVNPAPVAASLNPSTVFAGGSGFTMAVNGSGFVPGSVVRVNGETRQTTFTSATQLAISVAASEIASPGALAITVFNPAPGGGTSNVLTLKVEQKPNPVPALSTIGPSSAVAGGDTFILTLTGSDFVQGAVVRWNGQPRPATFIGPSSLTASIAAADIANAGPVTVTVFNPAPGGGESNSLTFTIIEPNPVPAVSAVFPASAPAGGPAFQLTVTGSGFVAGSVVQWNGSPRPTAFVGATQVTATIAAADIAAIGTAEIRVFNPLPGGGLSNGAPFAIVNPVPVVTSITPLEAFEGDPALTITVNGLNFIQGSVLNWNGSPRPTTVVSASQLTARISDDDLFNPGAAILTVSNPSPGGGVSNTWVFTVRELTVNCQAICLRSAVYYASNINRLPGGRVLIGGVNFNNPILIQGNLTQIGRALAGGSSPLQALNKEYVAIQLSVLTLGGLGLPTAAQQTMLRCYEPQLATVTLSNGTRITRNTMFADLLEQCRLAIVENREDDMLQLAGILSILNGNDPSGFCK